MLIKLDFCKNKIKSRFCNKNRIKRTSLIYFFIAIFFVKFGLMYTIG